jgi:hypothetical protein
MRKPRPPQSKLAGVTMVDHRHMPPTRSLPSYTYMTLMFSTPSFLSTARTVNRHDGVTISLQELSAGFYF